MKVSESQKKRNKAKRRLYKKFVKELLLGEVETLTEFTKLNCKKEQDPRSIERNLTRGIKSGIYTHDEIVKEVEKELSKNKPKKKRERPINISIEGAKNKVTAVTRKKNKKKPVLEPRESSDDKGSKGEKDVTAVTPIEPKSDKTIRMTAMQEKFVEEFVVYNNRNGAKAAINAGYSSHSARQISYANLSKDYIIEAIDKENRARAEKAGLTKDDALKIAKNTAEGTMKDVAICELNGNIKIIPFDEMNDKGLAVFKKLKYREIPTQFGVAKEIEIDLRDNSTAIKELFNNTPIPLGVIEAIEDVTEKFNLDIYQQMGLYEKLGYSIPKSLELKAKQRDTDEEDFDFLGDLDNEEYEREQIAKKKAEIEATREAELKIRKQELIELDRKEESDQRTDEEETEKWQ